MNSIGVCGASSTQARAARSARGGRERVDALAERAIADLVVGLQEGHEGGRRQVRRTARRAARRRETRDGWPW